MVDLETLGKQPGYVVLQIGACAFDIDSPALAADSWRVRLESSLAHGLEIDPDTLRWWMQQSDEARRNVFGGPSKPLSAAIDGFLDFLENYAADDFNIWSHGAAFDIPILERCFTVTKQRVPWHYRSIRDTRTLADLYPIPRPRPPLAHCAKADAVAQARWVAEILREHVASVARSSPLNASDASGPTTTRPNS